MKRLVFILLCVMSLTLVNSSLASIDLTGLTYEELIALKEEIDIAIMQSNEWQEITLPQKAVYFVGKDIPAGHWTITAADGQWTSIRWGGSEEGRDRIYKQETVVSPTDITYRHGDPTQIDVELEDGQYLDVRNGDAVLSTYSGSPSLGFK